jgi:hypothetical protein
MSFLRVKCLLMSSWKGNDIGRIRYGVLCTDFYHFRNDAFSPIFTAYKTVPPLRSFPWTTSLTARADRRQRLDGSISASAEASSKEGTSHSIQSSYCTALYCRAAEAQHTMPLHCRCLWGGLDAKWQVHVFFKKKKSNVFLSSQMQLRSSRRLV